MRIVFAGFGHTHALLLYNELSRHSGIEIVATCEEDPQTLAWVGKTHGIQVTHDDYGKCLENVDAQAVAIGGAYSSRGQMIIRALNAGRHVISDKPICTCLEDLARIASISSQKSLAVGCHLDMRNTANLRTVRRLIRQGAIGQVQTVTFTGQHPLMFHARPHWYFQPGLHGGTINDIAVHAVDAIPWITGLKFVEVVAARTWNAALTQAPSFRNAAQMMLRMDNDAGVIGDVSFLAPEQCGYLAPQYWRITCHGDNGVIESISTQKKVLLADHSDKAVREVPLDSVPQGQVYLESFIREVTHSPGEISPSTKDVLEASRIALMIQWAADTNQTRVPL